MRSEVSGASQRRWIATLLASTFIVAQSPTFAAPLPQGTQPQAPSSAPAASSAPATTPSDEERAAARTAATDGVQLLEAGKYAEALDRLRRAEALVHAPTHMLYIARAQAKLGQLVEASETYLRIVHETLGPDAPRPFVEAQTSAEQEVKDLDPRIPRLLIRVTGPGAGEASVTMDSTAIPPAMVGLSAPVDPGTHVVRATAKSGETAETQVKLAAGSQETAVLALHGVTPAAAPGPVASPAAGGEAQQAALPESPGGSGARKAISLTVMGLGVAGIAVGTAFVFINRSKRTDANEMCNQGAGNLCPIAGKPQIDALDGQASTAQTVAWIGYAAGAAVLVTGLVLFLTAPSAKPAALAARARGVEGLAGVRPWVGVGSLGLTGNF